MNDKQTLHVRRINEEMTVKQLFISCKSGLPGGGES